MGRKGDKAEFCTITYGMFHWGRRSGASTYPPHTAFGTTKSFIKRADIVFNNVIQYLAGSPQNPKTR